MLLSPVVKLVRRVPYVTATLGAVVGLDWLLLSHSLFDDTAFLAKMSFFSALLVVLASSLCIKELTAKVSTSRLALTGILSCVLLGFSNLQGIVNLGTSSPPTLIGFGSLFVVAFLMSTPQTERERLTTAFAVGILVCIKTLFVFGLMTWHQNQHQEINSPTFSFFSPATGTLLYLLAVCYLDQFCFIKKTPGKGSPARDLIVALCLFYPLIIAGGNITAGLLSGHELEIVYQGLGAALTTLFMGYLRIAFGWNTWRREEAAVRQADEANAQLARRLVETKHLEHEAIRLAESNEAYANEQRHFSTMLAHEIRTPLNTITGLVNSFGSNFNTKSTCSMNYCFSEFDLIKESTDYLYDLVNSVLDYNKLKEGKLAVENEPFRPVTLCNSIEHFYKDRALNKNLAFTIELEDGLPKQLLGDSVRIRQILGNLLDNAIKFTSQGFVRLSVNTSTDPNGNPIVCYEVKDSGIGIEQKDLVRIFEPFRQANAHIRSKYGGTGVGLSLCNDLATLMNGSIKVSSKLGHGSAFALQLPLVESTAPHTLSTLEATANYNLLMVEDHHLNAKINQRLLESAGYAVDWVDTGEKAVEAAQKVKYDAILMDLDLGTGISGYEATRRIKRNQLRNNPPVLALTAALTDELGTQLEAAGIQHCLEKPFVVDTAARTINQAIDLHRKTETKGETTSSQLV